jgi:DNA ligase 1
MHISHTFLFRVLCIVALLFLPLYATAQDILLAQIYSQGVDVKQYLVSEKLDGVRAIWDGKQLKSRKGNVINAPVWFVKDLPNTPLDGELWLARGQFDVLSGAVRKDIPVDAEWKNITYQIFELPNATGTFEVRAKRMVKIVEQLNIPHLKTVVQFRVKNETELNKKLKQIVAKGGEGLMLHRADAAYITGRSDALLKLKLLHDAEAIVIAHLPGKGKYTGKLGALLVQAQNGMRFKLGTGFSDAQRANPPEIGSTITYTYLDKTKNGKPKFASFLRVRNEK